MIRLRVLAVSGYGLWMWLGMALALGLHRVGRNGTLMPLALGAILVSLGLVLTCLRVRPVPDWHGWRPGRGSRPTRSALMALVTYLPMLAVAGLARGDNAFWATRLSGVLLMLCSLASLIYSAYRYRSRLSPGMRRISSLLPVSRLATAWYAGGLWLWLCTLVQDELHYTHNLYPWILLLLVLALLLGLLESMRWQPVLAADVPHGVVPVHGLRPLRFIAALFTYVVPCGALLLTEHADVGLVAAAVAVPSCLLGKMLEQQLYASALGGVLRRGDEV